MKTIYHTQTTTKACAFCGAPFIGHPHRDYCSPRCKRKAKEYRYKTTNPETTPEKFYSHEYGTVTPTLAISIFEYLQGADENTAPVLIKGFTDPDKTILPRDLSIYTVTGGYMVNKGVRDNTSSITEELDRITPKFSPTDTFIIPPPVERRPIK